MYFAFTITTYTLLDAPWRKKGPVECLPNHINSFVNDTNEFAAHLSLFMMPAKKIAVKTDAHL